MHLRPLTDWLVYALVRTFICIVQSIQIETYHTVARLLAFFACDVIKLRYGVMDDNIRHVFKQWDAARRRRFIRQTWEHLFLMVAEVGHVRRKVNEASFRRHVEFINKPVLVEYLLDPRPVVLVTGHFGNFEVAGYILGLFGFPSYTIARKLTIRTWTDT